MPEYISTFQFRKGVIYDMNIFIALIVGLMTAGIISLIRKHYLKNDETKKRR